MILKNAKIFDSKFNIVQSDIEILGEKIVRVAPDLEGEDILDVTGTLVAPGFVDIHIHGCVGADACDGTRDSIGKMAKHLIQMGVTSFCPTTMTISLSQIKTILEVVSDCMKHPPTGASVRGVNMEGPYISTGRKGVQKEEYIRTPNWKEFKRLYDSCGGIIKLVDIAPESEAGMEFADHVSQFCRVSLAHTEANYEQAMESFQHGITHVTHLFNAMSGFHHRDPGVVGAVFDDKQVRAEMICDGIHISPAALRVAFRMLGEDRTIVVSDSIRAAGMSDGVSELGGQVVYVKNGQARLADGTLAGSTTNIHQEIQNLVKFGIPLRQAIKSATINPALEIGSGDEIGSIEQGKEADLVIMDSDLNLKLVIAKGKIVNLQ